jgi:NAD(P)-dependent dehydrogenase (short-subunit alcohol dehydrogenase family)
MDVAGRTFVVTGGATGMGRAGVELLRELDANVALIDVNDAEGCTAAARTGARFYHADVSVEADVKNAFLAIEADFGPIHGLWSNAGIQLVEALLHDEIIEDWDRTISVNLRGTFLVVREAMKRFVAAGYPGSIVCTSSVVGRQAVPGGCNAYTSTKGAIDAFVRQVAVDYASRGIRINSVAPGAVDTPLMWGTTPPEEIDRMRALVDREIPLGKIGRPIDIARCAVWLLSDEACYVSGASFAVDGALAAKLAISV